MKYGTKTAYEAECRRVQEIIRNTQSDKLRRDQTKYLHRLWKEMQQQDYGKDYIKI